MNSKAAVFSVFYNRGYCVTKSVESLVAQDYPNLQIILVDDGSTDDTLDQLREFENHPNIKIITGTNKGFVSALKNAIKETPNIDYISIHGSGDYSAPSRISKQIAYLENDKSLVGVGCFFENEFDDGTVRLIEHDNATVRFDDLLTRNFFSHGEVTFRSSVYEKVGGYRTAFEFAQDRDLWLRMSRFGTFSHVPEVLYKRYVRKDGVETDYKKKVVQRMMSQSAVENAIYRQQLGFDWIDILGDQGLFFRKRNFEFPITLRMLSSKINDTDLQKLYSLTAEREYTLDLKLYRIKIWLLKRIRNPRLLFRR